MRRQIVAAASHVGVVYVRNERRRRMAATAMPEPIATIPTRPRSVVELAVRGNSPFVAIGSAPPPVVRSRPGFVGCVDGGSSGVRVPGGWVVGGCVVGGSVVGGWPGS